MTNPSITSTPTDLLIIGGGPAGLTAATFFARLNRPFILYDSGLYRNDQSPAAHTIPGFEGVAPGFWRERVLNELRVKYGSGEVNAAIETQIEEDGDDRTNEQTSKEPVVSMGTFDYRRGKIVKLEKVTRDGRNVFEAEDEEGRKVVARKVVLATGLKDILPDIPGLQQAWGTRAIHCIYCHGTETHSQPFGYLLPPGNPMNKGIAPSILKLWYNLGHGPERYVLTHGADVGTREGRKESGLGEEGLVELLREKGYTIISDKITSIDNHPNHLTLNFISHLPINLPHLLVLPLSNAPSSHALPLLTPTLLTTPLTPFGTIPAPADPAKNIMPLPRMGDSPATPVKGLFWAGNSGSFVANVQASCAQGMNAAVVAGEELGEEDLEEMMREMKGREGD